MENLLIVNHTDEATRIAVVEEGLLTRVDFESASERQIVGNIYKGKVVRVLPGMNAAFVDVGLERTAFLYAYDILGPKTLDEEQVDDDTSALEKAARDDVHIETLVRENQEILVQVAKEPLGSKGARVTCNASLPGVLVVLLPTVDHVGISRKIDDPTERERLKQVGESIRPPGVGIIMRTIAEGRPEEELRREVEFLHRLWTQITRGAEAVDAPALIHEDLDLLLKTAREIICRKVDKLIIDSETGGRSLENFISRFLPATAIHIEVYTGTTPIFERYGIEYEIARALQRKVWLKSGGYIVIERTEALAVVDVNSGKFTGKSDPEDTILKTNIEAVDAIAHQLRLRDIGGIIVIDFIDMKSKENRALIYDRLLELLKKDHAKSRVLPMSELGLLQMTRKRVSESLSHRLTEPCFYCEGKGYLKSPVMIAHYLFAKIEKEVLKHTARTIHVHANPGVIEKLMEVYGSGLERMEKGHRRAIVITERESFHMEHFEVFGER